MRLFCCVIVSAGLAVTLPFAGCDDGVHRPSENTSADADASTGEDGSPDAAPLETGSPDTAPSDTPSSDNAPPDVTQPETVASDTAEPDGVGDAVVGQDAPVADTGPADAPVADESAQDVAPSDVPPADDVVPDVQADTTVAPDNAPDAAQDTGPVDVVPVFIAQGHVGRTIMSCDGGVTWVHDRAYDIDGDPHVCGSTAPVTCWSDIPCDYFNLDTQQCQAQPDPFCDCDHHPGRATGIDYGNGYWLATWGWGPKGSVRRSVDGANWQIVVDASPGMAGLSYTGTRWVGGGSLPLVSVDDGDTWQEGDWVPFNNGVENARRSAYVDVAGGLIVLTGETGGARDVVLSSDAGDTWWHPDVLPGACGNWVNGIAGGNGTIVISHAQPWVCTSTDGGATFQVVDLDPSEYGSLAFDGSQFHVFGIGTHFASSDGLSWSGGSMGIGNYLFEASAADPTSGTIVGVAEAYANQAFFRSTDGGQTWAQAASWDGGHPLTQMRFGYANPTGACAP